MSSLGEGGFRGGNHGADLLAQQSLGHIAGALESEDADALLVVPRHGKRRSIHDRKIVDQCTVIAQRGEALGVLVFARIGSVYAVHAVLAISTSSQWISRERWMDTVSVEKYGMPAPAPKITTRPFSR